MDIFPTEESFDEANSLFHAKVNYDDYTGMTVEKYFMLLLGMFLFHAILNCVILCCTRKSFLKRDTFQLKAGHLLSTLAVITVWNDIDEENAEDHTKNKSAEDLSKMYLKKWKKEHLEFCWKFILHTVLNVCLTLPWLVLFLRVQPRHALFLETTGTHPMEDASFATIQTGAWALPTSMIFAGVINYIFYRIYIRFGHPCWSVFLKSEQELVQIWQTLKLWKVLERGDI